MLKTMSEISRHVENVYLSHVENHVENRVEIQKKHRQFISPNLHNFLGLVIYIQQIFMAKD